MKKILLLISTFYCLHFINGQNQNQIFSYEDVYDIQYVSDPQISPSGNEIIYRRMRFDILKDRAIGNLWVINVDDYRDYWVNMANNSNFMVFAPEFESGDFSSDEYNLGNIFDDGDNPSSGTYNPIEEWTFSMLDPLFEYVKSKIKGTQETYNGWGHSAGSQFLHRFVMFIPNSKLNIAVCSNAGWYTVPESEINFPYGLDQSQLDTNKLNLAFSKKLYVHLAEDDTNPNSSSLRHNEIVDDQQGLHRRARGRYFYATSEDTANQNQTEFNWIKTDEVPNVSHQGMLMAQDAVRYLYPEN